MMFSLALSVYWSSLLVIAIAGIALLVFTVFRRRGWWWKLPAAFALMTGPYVLDVARARVGEGGESWNSAVMPTTFLLSALGPDTNWPYGIVFDRLHKAPPRHQLWDSQLDKLLAWCDACVAQKDSNMAKRGVQIAGTLYQRGRKKAVEVMRAALEHHDPAVRLLAVDVLAGTGDDAERARAALENMRKSDRDNQVRRQVEQLLWKLSESKAAE